jgi:hypothetical protein
MALRLRDVQCDPIADRALKELMHRYTVAEEKSGLVLTEKAGNMKLLAVRGRPPSMGFHPYSEDGE